MNAAIAPFQPVVRRSSSGFRSGITSWIRGLGLAAPSGRRKAAIDPDAIFPMLFCQPHPSGSGNPHNQAVRSATNVLNERRSGFNHSDINFLTGQNPAIESRLAAWPKE